MLCGGREARLWVSLSRSATHYLFGNPKSSNSIFRVKIVHVKHLEHCPARSRYLAVSSFLPQKQLFVDLREFR